MKILVQLIFIFTIGILLYFSFSDQRAFCRAQDQEEQTTQQESTKQTDPEFIVVYNMRVNEKEPLVNMRVVIHAKSESDAIVRATLYLNKTFGSVIDMDKLRFVEAAPKRVIEPEKKATLRGATLSEEKK